MRKRLFLSAVLALGLLGTSVVMAAGELFPDVQSSHPHAEAIGALRDVGIVDGHADGLYRPGFQIDRAAFAKIIAFAVFNRDGQRCLLTSGAPFSDVDENEWYAGPVCVLKAEGVLTGYDDGTFRPAQPISFAEAATVVVRAYGLPVQPDHVWYRPAVSSLSDLRAIPLSITDVGQSINRGEMAEMIYRVAGDITDKTSQTIDALLYSDCVRSPQVQVPGADIDKARKFWLAWVNVERAKLGLHAYELNDQLSRTAADWANTMAERGAMGHVRDGQTSGEYDFEVLTDWFADRGLVFGWVEGYMHTENVGRGYYLCEEADCTQDLIDALRSNFDLYIAQKDDEDRPHYSSMMNPHFRQMGIGVGYDADEGRYYLTLHYGTYIIGTQKKVCL